MLAGPASILSHCDQGTPLPQPLVPYVPLIISVFSSHLWSKALTAGQGSAPGMCVRAPAYSWAMPCGGPSQGLQKSLEVLDSGGSHGPKATWRDSEGMGLGM